MLLPYIRKRLGLFYSWLGGIIVDCGVRSPWHWSQYILHIWGSNLMIAGHDLVESSDL